MCDIWKKKNLRNGQENIEHTPPVCRWTHKHKEEAACEALGNTRVQTVALIPSDRMKPGNIQPPWQSEIVLDRFCCSYTNTLPMCLLYLLWFSDPRQ